MRENVPTFHINMDRKCAECGKGGAADSGICLECTSIAIKHSRAMKSPEGRAVKARFTEIRKMK